MKRQRLKLHTALAPAIVAAAWALCGAAATPKYTVLYNFTGGADGSAPTGGLTVGAHEFLYGTTIAGGNMNECNGYGCGAVFQLSPQGNGKWTESVLHSFANDGHDGYDPQAKMTLDSSGDIYGTTTAGGAYDLGAIFQLSPETNGWSESILYSFGSQNGDGYNPIAGLAMDMAGNLYGTAPLGGSTAFELTPGSGGWNEEAIHRFGVKKGDGADPAAGLILDQPGDLYGTTGYGGTGCAGEGCGTVYELSPATNGGWKETVLHRFLNNGKDGYTPGNGALFKDAQGNLYGTTEVGGANGVGTVFEVARRGGRWKESILYSFKNDSTGSSPGAGVLMDKAGNLYGTTVDGGLGDCGVIYKLAPGPKNTWVYTVLHEFLLPFGCVPTGNLVMDRKGNLYGGTLGGGTGSNGVIFLLTP
jgi:uncharacterized repeat protein (TIGR03803 family)